MIGVTIINCAIIIIAGEYNISKNPRNPDAEKIIYNNKPTTTGGILINVLTIIIIIFFPKKSDEAIQAAIIIETNADNKVANSDT